VQDAKHAAAPHVLGRVCGLKADLLPVAARGGALLLLGKGPVNCFDGPVMLADRSLQLYLCQSEHVVSLVHQRFVEIVLLFQTGKCLLHQRGRLVSAAFSHE
jgi:hypothetical protein